MIGAREVNLLIADFCGRALVRLTSDRPRRRCPAPGRRSRPRRCRSRARLRPGAAGSAGGRPGARRRRPDDGPGDRPGRCDRAARAGPAAVSHRRTEVADIAGAAHALAYVVIAARRYTDVFEWGQRTGTLRPRRGDPAPPAAGHLHLRGRAVHPGRLAGAGQLGRRGTPSTTHWTATRSRCRSPTPSATRWQPHCSPPCSSAACATDARRGGFDLADQARLRQRCAGRERRTRPVRHRPAAACRPAHRAGLRSSTPATRFPCGCATAGWRRSSWASNRRSGSVPGQVLRRAALPARA